MSYFRNNTLVAGVAVQVLLGSGGCAPRPEAIHQQRFENNENNLAAIGAAYQQACAQLGRPPKNMEELQAHLGTVDHPEDLLRSPMDGQPYAICWGVDLRSLPEASRASHVLAYEKHGSDGVRCVLTADRKISFVTDEELFKLRFPSGQVPDRRAADKPK